MNRHALFIGAAAIVALTSSRAEAQTLIHWQGGTGTLIDANYSDGTNLNLSPQSTDYVHLGNDGTVTLSDGAVAGFGRLRVGHNVVGAGGTGPATLTLSGVGTMVELTAGSSGQPNAALWVGNGNNGTLTIEDSAVLVANRLVLIGAGSSAAPLGTLNVTTGGSLIVNDGNLSIADRSGNTGNGIRGVVNLSGANSSIHILGPGADLVMGNLSRTAIFNQTDGTVSVTDSVEVGTSNGSSTGTTLSISGGTLTTGTGTGATAGNFFVGRGAAVNPTVNISGTAVVNVGNRYLMGGSSAVDGGFATGVTTNHSGGTLNTDLDIRVADAFPSETSDATYNLSGTGVINSTTGGIIGRQGIGRFFQTGGEANFNGAVSIGDRQAAPLATEGLYKISAGALNVATALNVAPNGTGELRVVGDDATINVTGDFSVNNTVNGAGTLAFELEAGDLLSMIDVSGTATFHAGAILRLDATNAAPTASTYDLLTAASIVDSGIAFSGPAGWGYQIVSGGNGQILQIVEGIGPGLIGDYNDDGVVDAADYVLWRKTDINGDQGYLDWRANFGATSPGAGAGAIASVPEPGTWLLIVLAMAAIRIGRTPRFAEARRALAAEAK